MTADRFDWFVVLVIQLMFLVVFVAVWAIARWR
jgi:hypothetical protein